jgi:hypothetical protein
MGKAEATEMITSKEGIEATALAAKMANVLKLQSTRTATYAAMLLMVAVIEQWPDEQRPKSLTNMLAYMRGNLDRLEAALQTGRFGRPQ